METTDLIKIEEIFGVGNDPSITVNYFLKKSSIKDAVKVEILTITKNLGDPLGTIKYSFSINMDEILVEIGKIKSGCATINSVLNVFANFPSGFIHEYFTKKDLSGFANYVKKKCVELQFGL